MIPFRLLPERALGVNRILNLLARGLRQIRFDWTTDSRKVRNDG